MWGGEEQQQQHEQPKDEMQNRGTMEQRVTGEANPSLSLGTRLYAVVWLPLHTVTTPLIHSLATGKGKRGKEKCRKYSTVKGKDAESRG